MDFHRLVSKRSLAPAILVVAFVLLLVLPQFAHGYIITLFVDILKFVILSVSWTIFSGPTGFISLATAAFYGIGIYTAAVLSGTLPFGVIIILAGVLSFIVALGVGALTLRLKGIYFAIFTFGLVELIRYVVLEVERIVTQTRGRFVVTESSETVYYAVFIVLLATLLTAYLIRRSRYGLALQTIGEHEEAAAHTGIDVTRTKVLTFAVSAIFMGMVGAIIATRRTYIDPGIAFDVNNSFFPVLMAMFGGISQLYGPIIGAVIFTYLGEFLLTSFPDLYMLIFGSVLVLSILYMPNGIVGVLQKWWRKIRGGAHAPT